MADSSVQTGLGKTPSSSNAPDAGGLKDILSPVWKMKTKAFTRLGGDGMLYSTEADGKARVIHQRFPRLERGTLVAKAIVIHQTNSHDASSVFAQYGKPGTVAGAHFLIDKDGTIYQTGSINKRMNHVGDLHPRKYNEGAPWERDTYQKGVPWNNISVQEASTREQKKTYPDKYPGNTDSIGIELVGFCGPASQSKTCTYEPVTLPQVDALTWLLSEIAFRQNALLVFAHGAIGLKNPTEAQSAISELLRGPLAFIIVNVIRRPAPGSK